MVESFDVAVCGAGPSGLMAAEVAATAGARVAVFDRMPSPGRKLLLAGRGGLNLTHSEDFDRFRARYCDGEPRIAAALDRFGPDDLRQWCATLGIDTFVGTSGRVFPTSFKTSPLLRAWLRRLDASGVVFRMRHLWTGWDGERLRFETPHGDATIEARATVLAFGGASWPHLGTDGRWLKTVQDVGVDCTPLRPANCGFMVDWSEPFRAKFEGQPLKAVALRFAGETTRGDIVITRRGLEGGPIYALAPRLRQAITRDGEAILEIALRPDVSAEALAARLAKRRVKDSLSNVLRRTLRLDPVAIGLMRETAPDLIGFDASQIAHLVNALPVRLTAPMPMERAISTAGGIRFAAVGDDLMLGGRPGVFAAGEMLDWEAPTGGYLLQACFATGVVAGEAAARWAAASPAKVEADAGAPRVV